MVVGRVARSSANLAGAMSDDEAATKRRGSFARQRKTPSSYCLVVLKVGMLVAVGGRSED